MKSLGSGCVREGVTGWKTQFNRGKQASVLMRWMKLELIIQSEVSQKEKHQYTMKVKVKSLNGL